MVTRVPVNHNVVKWARERCHLDLREAANLLKCDVNLLRQIEDGDAMPVPGLFRRMAGKYLLPEATLLGDTLVAERPLPKDFRSFDGAPVKISYQTIRAIRKVQARQEAIANLSEIDGNIKPSVLPIVSLQSDPEAEGASFRVQLGFDVSIQLAITGEKAFVKWRTLVERMGVSVYVEPLGEDDTRGVSDSFNGFPSIIIDQREKLPGARLFTLFHELAHHLVGEVGISNLRSGNQVERFCNRFAAAFLMPREAVMRVLPHSRKGATAPTIAALDQAAKRLCVTISAVALRLEEFGFVDAGYYTNVKNALRVSKPSKGGPDYKYSYLSQYGENLPHCVLDAYDSGLISSVEASRAMNTSPTHFNDIRAALKERWAELADAG